MDVVKREKLSKRLSSKTAFVWLAGSAILLGLRALNSSRQES